MHTYMAEIVLPEMTEEFLALIPEQRAQVNRLMSAGQVASYGLALDRSKVWMTVVAPSEREALDLLATFPIAPYVDITLTELMFMEHPQLNVTHFSLN